MAVSTAKWLSLVQLSCTAPTKPEEGEGDVVVSVGVLDLSAWNPGHLLLLFSSSPKANENRGQVSCTLQQLLNTTTQFFFLQQAPEATIIKAIKPAEEKENEREKDGETMREKNVLETSCRDEIREASFSAEIARCTYNRGVYKVDIKMH